MRLKPVFRYDTRIQKFRIARVVWQFGRVGDGHGYSAKISIALTPRLFRWSRQFDGWRLTVLGVDLHHQRAYGGIIV